MIASSQEALYLSQFGQASGTGSFADPDGSSLPADQGLWGADNTSPSPQGGNYWLGQLTGAGGGASNFQTQLVTGLSSTNFIDSTGASPIFTNGQDYELHFWMNPFEFVTDDGTDSGVISKGALTFDISGASVLSSGFTQLQKNDTYSQTIGFGQWTELAIPFTYDAAWDPGFLVVLNSPFEPTHTIDITPLQTEGTVLPGENRIQSVGIDFGATASVPEPSGVLLISMASMAFLLGRRR